MSDAQVSLRSGFARPPADLRVGSVPQGTSLRLRDGVPEWRFSTSRKRASRARHTHHRPAGEIVHVLLQQPMPWAGWPRPEQASAPAPEPGSMRLSGCPRRHSRRALVAGPTRWRRSGESEILPMLRAIPGLRPITVWPARRSAVTPGFSDDLRRTLERRVPAMVGTRHGPERDVIFRQEHPPGQQGLSDFTDTAELGVSIADVRLEHRLSHFRWRSPVGSTRAWCWAARVSLRWPRGCRMRSGPWVAHPRSIAATVSRRRSAIWNGTPWRI